MEEYYKYLSSQNLSNIYERNELYVVKFFNMSMRDVGKFIINNKLIDYEHINFGYWGQQAEQMIISRIVWLLIPFTVGLKISNKEDEISLVDGENYELFRKFVFGSSTFWNILDWAGVRQRLNWLCALKDSSESTDKDKVIRTIYNKLYENPIINIEQVSSKEDEFWYHTKRIMDATLHFN